MRIELEKYIEIDNYLTENEIKKICIDEIKNIVRTGGERLVNNLAYTSAAAILDGALDNDHFDQIRKRAVSIIDDLTDFTVFRKKDAWGSEDSIAYKVLQGAMDENSDLIREKVRSLIETHDFGKELNENSEYIIDVVVDALSRGFQKQED